MSRNEDTPLASVERLRQEILDRYDSLSKRLKQIARYVLDEPHAFGLETLAEISERSGAQPSAIVRFAKHFGFSGASQMQRVFRDGLLSNHAQLGYNERVRAFSASMEGANPVDSHAVLMEFVHGSTIALDNLPETVTGEDLQRAIDLVAEAETIYIIGYRRSFPVASYLAYSLQQTGKRTTFVDGIAGLSLQQVRAAGARDLLIAVSYHPYSPETTEVSEFVVERGAALLAITDTPVSPIAKLASSILLVRETEVRSFRSLSASLCLAQALAIGFAFRHSGPADAPGIEAQG
ncbi:MurR/RpiR family transcriptional regulator [Sphingomonas quercus]|uniref:MurR/RpiR family transcriptional regulator n=1 Tax=Sphingomonas quercus TaxID=2842451 RepID=A0ABS6BGS7_9SPHN|nr:MurR/RpiR family transcriptional regulator [Sphingomonas quercus]MBU3077508.1 MurR/RpiR family transcriptional regulator [Sphingomonas quercus]